MTSFEDRIRRMTRADYCGITFTDENIKPIEIPKPLGTGGLQEVDEIMRALQYRFGT